jgi:hypothetical protein
MFGTILGGGAAAVVGTTLLGNVVTGTLHTLYNTMEYLKNGVVKPEYFEHIHSHLRKLDIEMKIQITQEFLAKDEHQKTKSELIVENGIRDIITDINTILTTIHARLTEHETKWFASYRQFDISKELANIEELNCILDKRLDLIIKLSNVNSVVM